MKYRICRGLGGHGSSRAAELGSTILKTADRRFLLITIPESSVPRCFITAIAALQVILCELADRRQDNLLIKAP